MYSPHWHAPPTLPGAVLVVGDPITGAFAVPPLPLLGRSSFFEWRPTHQRPEPSLAVSGRSSVDKGYRRIVSLERTATTEAINARFRIYRRPCRHHARPGQCDRDDPKDRRRRRDRELESAVSCRPP